MSHQERFVYPLVTGYRVFWTEEEHGACFRMMEMDCVIDDFGDLIGVPHNREEIVSKGASGWSYRATAEEARWRLGCGGLLMKDEQTNDQAHASWLAQVAAMDDTGDYFEREDAAQLQQNLAAGRLQARMGG